MDFQQIRDFVNPAVAQATGMQEVENLSMPVPVAYVPVQLVIDGALSLTSENPVQNKVIAVAIQNLDGRITAVEGQFAEGVTEAVNNWLAAHPEATTTVQDGAITYAKLDANLKGEVDQISELRRAIEALEPVATEADVGKALIAKTVVDGKVTEYEFGEAGGGSSTYKFVPENLYDAENKVGTMTINGNTVTNLSNWIPVKSTETYTTDYTWTQFYFFDSSKVYVGFSSLTSEINRITPEQDGYLLIATKGDNKNFVRGSYLSYNPGRISRWNRKKWLVIGDSISSIAYAPEGYPFVVGSALGMEVTNVALSGKTMAYYQDLIDGYADDYDLVTVMLGTNDQGYNCGIGALNDQYYQDHDYATNNSFYARTQRVFDLLTAKYPYATIAFLTPLRRSAGANDGADKTNSQGLTTKAYADAVIACAEYYGIPVLDLYTHGINPRYDTIRARYFVDGDGTHPNDDGHAKYTAPVIDDFLSSISPFFPVTMTGISATYTGGSVSVGTSVDDLDGITVTASYSDGTSEIVTGYTLSGTIAEGENTVTVAYEGFTTTFTVVGISVTTDSITAVYNGGAVLVGTNINTLDVTVTAHYSDSTSAVVTGYTLSGTIAAGSNTITVTYDGCTTTFTVTGVESALIHSYAYNADYSNGLPDSVGDADLSYNSNYKRLTNTADIGAEALSSFSIVWKNLSRTGLYFEQLPSIDTGGRDAFNTAPYTNTGKRIWLSLRSTSNLIFGDGYFSIEVGHYDGVITKGTTVIENNTTHSVVLTFDASTYTYKVYVDGALDITYVSDQPCAVDGINILHADFSENMQWGALEVYAGIVDPSNV